MTILHRRSSPFHLCVQLCTVVVLALCGCTRQDAKVTIRGQVTLDGTSIDNGTISFRPVSDEGATAGNVIVAGRYEVSLPPGKKKVEIQAYRKVGERRSVPWEPKSPMVPVKQQIVPEKYNAETMLTYEVTSDADNVDFPLEATAPTRD
jgi:hypothetical protein